MKEKAEFST